MKQKFGEHFVRAPVHLGQQFARPHVVNMMKGYNMQSSQRSTFDSQRIEWFEHSTQGAFNRRSSAQQTMSCAWFVFTELSSEQFEREKEENRLFAILLVSFFSTKIMDNVLHIFAAEACRSVNRAPTLHHKDVEWGWFSANWILDDDDGDVTVT